MEQIFCEKNMDAVMANYAQICQYWVEYEKVEAMAWEEYEKVEAMALEEYNNV